MRQKFTRWLSLLTVCCMLAVYCTTAQAVLLDLGPTDLPSPPGTGIPTWYRDTNRVPLEPCLSQASFPGGLAACILLPDPGFNPVLPLVFPTNFPSESFYFLADANLNTTAGNIVYRAALEAAFPIGVAAGNPITFTRIRLVADLPVAGTYKITHPYGVETVVAAAAGKRAITFVRDIGVGAFTGALAGDLGPWLVMQGFPQTIGTETFLGNYNGASLPVTGSPFGTNFVRVDGPVGSNLDGLGNNFVQTNLFIMMGKVNTAALATPLTVERATYTRDAVNTQVEVFATTQPISNVRTNLPPNPFALLGIPSALRFSDTTLTVPATTMATNNANDGKFFGVSAPFPNPATLPTTVTVTNTADVPPTSINVPLVDEVVITEASFAPTPITLTGGTLKVVALSGDKVALPTLTVSMKDGLLVVPLGTIAGGSGTLSVNFPLVVGTKTYNIPPESITVTSALGGSDTDPVSNPLIQPLVPPVAVNDTATVASGGSVTINVAANDTTLNAGGSVVPASVAIVTGPTKGTVASNLGIITYTQLPASSGTDSFTYTILDNTGLISNVASVTVTISNNPPVATPFTATTSEDTAVIINVAANATDPDTASNPLNAVAPTTVLVTVAPLHGTATALGDGTVRYTPNLNYNNTALTQDIFAYTVSDTLGAVSNTAVVSITVTPVADQPLALNDLATTPQNTPVTINVLANDSHPDGPLSAIVPATLTIVTQPAAGAGTVSLVAGQLVYAPAPAFTGTASFTYTVSDNATPALTSLPATVTVTVTSVNNPPVAAPFTATTLEDTAVIIPVAANATDPDTALNPLNAVAPTTVLVTVAPLHGTATALGDGTVRYTPNLNYNNTALTQDIFAYTVRDTLGAVSNAAVVSITVTPVADPPLALNDFATTPQNTPVTINVLANDSNPDGPPSALVPASLAFTQPALGTGTVTAGLVAGQLVYTPAATFTGTATFTYTVSNNATPTALTSLPATVSVTVTPVSTPPTAVNDVASTFVNIPRIISVLANDTTGTSPINPASVALVGLPTNGTAVNNLNGTVTFTPTIAGPGTGTFTYNVKDSTGVVSNNATVTISIASAVADSVNVLRALFTNANRSWTIEGNTTNVSPVSRLVTIYVGNTLTGQILGTTTTNAADGRWKFQLPGALGNLGPDLTNTISVALPSGAARLAFPVAVK